MAKRARRVYGQFRAYRVLAEKGRLASWALSLRDAWKQVP